MEENEIDQMSVSGINISYRKGTVDEEVINHSFERDIFFKSMPEFNPFKANLVMDVGAHIGTFSLKTSSLNPGIKIIAVEASSSNFHLLCENIKMNNKEDSIWPKQVALSDRTGQEPLYMSDESWGHTTTNEKSTNVELVNSTTLEQIFAAHEIDNCDLVKFNCEGAEFKILLSTPSKVIKKVRMMLILLHEDLESNYDRQDVFQYLKENGFIFRTVNFTENRGWIIAKNHLYYSKWNNIFLKIKTRMSHLLL